jgi:hypothetical protein
MHFGFCEEKSIFRGVLTKFYKPMREFTNLTERSYLKSLSKMSKQQPNLNLGDFFSQCILKEDRLIMIHENEVILLFRCGIDAEKEFVKDIAGLISMIEILKEDKLLFLHENPDILQIALHKNCGNIVSSLTNDKRMQEKVYQSPANYGQMKLPTTLAKYIPNYVGQFCYVRPELVEYIDNEFCWTEEVRFKKTLFWTRGAAIIAFMGLLIALFGIFYQ